MRGTFLRLSLLGLASASLLASCTSFDEGTIETTAPNGAVIIRGDEQPLTSPSSAPRDRILRDYLKTRGAGSAVDQLRVVRQTTPHNGIVHIKMEQVVDGLRIHGAYAKGAIDAQGRLIQVIDNVVRPQPATHKPAVTAAEALAAAYAELGFTMTSEELGRSGAKTFFEPGLDFFREPSAELVAYVDDRGALRQGYLVETWYRADNQLEQTLVGHDGAVIAVERMTANDRYNVFVEDPLKGAQTIIDGGATPESPLGWLGTGSQGTQNISGNNAHAYLDADANNNPDSGGSAVTDGDFLTAVDLTAAPTTTGNRNVAVQNLFYLNNVVHDALYAAGFDEAAGNFQVNNFGLGGAGGDPVNAEAQDGGGTDNANFSTPTDGSSPRMQMYLWTPSGGAQVVVGASTYAASPAGFGPALSATGVTGDLAVASPADGCTAVSGVSGKVAIVDRGSCDFTVKVLNAQKAGATAVIVANNVGDSIFAMGGTNRKITISSVMVGQTSGAALKAAAGTSANVKKTPLPPQLDGDIDADIVFHEYGHGLTWRMVGNMSGAVSGALGEGSSDTVAFFLNGDDLIGEYSFSDTTNGIRRHRYEGYDKSYADLCSGGCEVHNDGEIFAAAMWRWRSNANALGVGNGTLLSVWVHSLDRVPAGPSFENMRDALAAEARDTYPGLDCAVWEAFAHFGIGVGSSATVRGTRSASVTVSTAVPANCQ